MADRLLLRIGRRLGRRRLLLIRRAALAGFAILAVAFMIVEVTR